MPTLPLPRLALVGQGLLHSAPFGRGLEATYRAIAQLGYAQIDTISVVARAHNHVLRDRVPNYREAHLHKLLKSRRIFETRFPVAAFRPMDDYRYSLPHADHWRAKPMKGSDPQAMRRVLERVRSDGPLRARDFEARRDKGGAWWDWKPAKRALEQLYFQGDLMIAARDGFEKSYDLPERVLPARVSTSAPTLAEFAAYLIDTTLRAHGFADAKTLGSGARFGQALGSTLRQRLAERTEDGQLRKLDGPAGKPIWALPQLLDGSAPRVTQRVRLLSPFDNAVTHRHRLEEVFGFDYQIECFVPAAKRRYGYYCLPILQGDRFVGRVDCKAHRNSATFEIIALYLESHLDRRATERLTRPLARAIRDYADFTGCNHVRVGHCQPRSYKSRLEEVLA